MKRFLALVLSLLLLVVCFVGCDKQGNGGNVNGKEDQGPKTIEYGAAAAETPLSNSYKLLHSGEKKLTIGYIGGSITYGSSAMNYVAGQKGGIELSYVNRVSNWFKETYPNATIETVNAGVSDTATNFGIYRLEKTLMNTDGHDMPDLVFVEFTTNDWFVIQTKADVLIQIESLIRNIWEINPYAEIVFISTQREYKHDSRKAYEEVAKKYNIPFIDVGSPLRSAIVKKCGAVDETGSGKYYYTIDNLHPSSIGYGVYFDTIKPVLEEQLKFEIKDWKLYDYNANLQAAVYKNLITNPIIMSVKELTVSGAAKLAESPLKVSMYGTKLTASDKEIVNCYVDVTGKATVEGKFSGATLGVLFGIKGDEKEFSLRYQIDGGEWKNFAVNSNKFAFQKYEHTQVFVFEHNLTSGEHTVKIEFQDGSETNFGGLLVNGK